MIWKRKHFLRRWWCRGGCRGRSGKMFQRPRRTRSTKPWKSISEIPTVAPTPFQHQLQKTAQIRGQIMRLRPIDYQGSREKRNPVAPNSHCVALSKDRSAKGVMRDVPVWKDKKPPNLGTAVGTSPRDVIEAGTQKPEPGSRSEVHDIKRQYVILSEQGNLEVQLP